MCTINWQVPFGCGAQHLFYLIFDKIEFPSTRFSLCQPPKTDHKNLFQNAKMLFLLIYNRCCEYTCQSDWVDLKWFQFDRIIFAKRGIPIRTWNADGILACRSRFNFSQNRLRLQCPCTAHAHIWINRNLKSSFAINQFYCFFFGCSFLICVRLLHNFFIYWVLFASKERKD